MRNNDLVGAILDTLQTRVLTARGLAQHLGAAEADVLRTVKTLTRDGVLTRTVEEEWDKQGGVRGASSLFGGAGVCKRRRAYYRLAAPVASTPAQTAAPAVTAPAAIVWTRTKAIVQAGEYPESNTTVNAWATADGRFTITPCGTVDSRRTGGFHGPRVRRFRWTGFRLVDTTGTGRWRKFYTVSDAKKAVARFVRHNVSL